MTAIGMTEEEVAAVQKTWNLVTAKLKDNGMEIMMLLFTKHPDYKQFFSKLKDLPTEELPKNSSMRAHAVTFMHGLSAFVNSLENTEDLVALLHANAERHFPRKITVTQYRNTVDLVPGFLKSKLGPEMDEVASSGWQKVIDAMVAVIGEKLEKMQIQETGTEIE